LLTGAEWMHARFGQWKASDLDRLGYTRFGGFDDCGSSLRLACGSSE